MTTADQQQQQQRGCSADYSQQQLNNDAEPSPTRRNDLPDRQVDAAELAHWVAAEMAARLDAQVPLCAFMYCSAQA